MPWDFALILILLATVVPLLGRRRVRELLAMPQTTRRDRLRLYASTILFQSIAAALILWRATRRGLTATSLALALPHPWLGTTIALALAGLVLLNQLVSLRRLAIRPSEMQGVLPQLALKIFPQDNTERLAFFALVVTVSICEEIIFRGFAQYVFEQWSGGLAIVGVAGSSALFALAHLYQGRRGLVSTLVVGLIFSSVRLWMGSLVPTVAAHFVADFSAGMLAPDRLRALAEPQALADTQHDQ